MIWLSWRQRRAAIIAFALVFGAIAALYLVDSIRLHHVFDASGLGQCVGVLHDPSCAARREVFLAYDVGWLEYAGYVITIASGALGVFLGAPMVSQEFERGTWQWVWTQRISRTRWLALNLLVTATSVTALGAALGAAYTWWYRPVAALRGPFGIFGAFDNTPLMCAVYSLFGFAVGVAASCFLRRTLAAMGLTFAVFLAARFGITVGARAHYLPPIAVTSPANEAGTPLNFDPRDWDYYGRWEDASGRPLSSADITRITSEQFNPAAKGHEWYDTLRQNGIHYYDLVQPYHRATLFQLIEAGIYLALVLGCFALAFWRVRRRTG